MNKLPRRYHEPVYFSPCPDSPLSREEQEISWTLFGVTQKKVPRARQKPLGLTLWLPSVPDQPEEAQSPTERPSGSMTRRTK